MDPSLNIHLIRSKKRKKTLSLRILENGKVLLSVPYHTPRREIERFLGKAEAWIVKKVWEREKAIRESRKVFIPGERFFYLGESYPLEIRKSDHPEPPLKLSFGKFILDQGHLKEARDVFIHWYRREAQKVIPERLTYYSQRLHLFPKGVRITNARCRWGSCSYDNQLSFSWRIILAPLVIIDYILIHELIHIKEKNHSERFWKFLESALPDYRTHRLWLKRNEYRLGF